MSNNNKYEPELKEKVLRLHLEEGCTNVNGNDKIGIWGCRHFFGLAQAAKVEDFYTETSRSYRSD